MILNLRRFFNWCLKVFVFKFDFLLLLSFFGFSLFLSLDVLLGFLGKEVLTCHHLVVFLSQLLLRREGTVLLLLLSNLFLLSFDVLLLEVG